MHYINNILNAPRIAISTLVDTFLNTTNNAIPDLVNKALNTTNTAIPTLVDTALARASEATPGIVNSALNTTNEAIPSLVDTAMDSLQASLQKQSIALIARITGTLPFLVLGLVAAGGVVYLSHRISQAAQKTLSPHKLVGEMQAYNGSYRTHTKAVFILSSLVSFAWSIAATKVAFFALPALKSVLPGPAVDLKKYIPTFLIEKANLFSLASRVLTVCGIIYQAYHKGFQEEPAPIFSKELTSTIDEIALATCNIQNHKGSFQSTLFHGPLGAGKKTAIKLIAKNSNMNYVKVSGADLATKEDLLGLVQSLNKSPTLLCIDGADHVSSELLSALLSLAEKPGQNLMLAFTATSLEKLPPAFIGKMDHAIPIAPPEALERRKILDQQIPRFFGLEEQKTLFSSQKIDELCARTSGLTGGLIIAMLYAILKQKNASQDNEVTADMIETTLKYFVDLYALKPKIEFSFYTKLTDLINKIFRRSQSASK